MASSALGAVQAVLKLSSISFCMRSAKPTCHVQDDGLSGNNAQSAHVYIRACCCLPLPQPTTHEHQQQRWHRPALASIGAPVSLGGAASPTYTNESITKNGLILIFTVYVQGNVHSATATIHTHASYSEIACIQLQWLRFICEPAPCKGCERVSSATGVKVNG
jgi:hypothetical protein